MITTWAVRLIVGALGVSTAAWLIHAARESWHRAAKVIDDARAELDAHDARALAIVCEPCSGNSGRCTCSIKCGHWLCGAADTGVMDIDAEYRALLDKEAGR